MANEYRISQEPVEAIVAPDSANARLSHEPVEVVVAPDSAAARLSQMPVEVIYRNLRERVSIAIID